MAIKIICNKCGIKCDEEFFRGFFYSVQMSSCETRLFHICEKCSSQIDETIIQALKKFLDIEGDVVLWTMTPYTKQA